MDSEIVFWLILVFVAGDFVVERWLAWLNRRAMAPVLPERLRGIYDEGE